jgi:proto-oncogene tyrosine-protein kinase Ret
VVQYAEVDCGQSIDFLSWKQALYPEEHRSIPVNDKGRFPKFDLNRIYVFRVATVNANGTAGFSQPSMAYGLDKNCVLSRNRSIILSQDLRVFGFLSKQIEISWKDPPLPKSSCFYACVRKTNNQLSDESMCQDGALLELVTNSTKVSTYVRQQTKAAKSDNCNYEARVSFLPISISGSGIFQYLAAKSVVWINIENSKDDIRITPSKSGLSMTDVKTHGYRVNITVMWSLPMYYNPELIYYEVSFGLGKDPIPLAGTGSTQLEKEDVYLTDSVDGKFTKVYPNVMPATEYWVQVLPVNDDGGGLTSVGAFMTTQEFLTPGIPKAIKIEVISISPATFDAVVRWNNSEPENKLDYPLVATYLQWGTGRKFVDDFVVGIIRVNKTVELFRIVGLNKTEDGLSVSDYWLQMWSSSAEGNTSKSHPHEFRFDLTGVTHTSSEDIKVLYIILPVFIAAAFTVFFLIFVYCHWRKKRQNIVLIARSDTLLPNLLYGQPPAGPTEVPDEWEVALDRVKLDYKLGEGFFGEVWKAIILGSFGPSERHASIVRTLSAKRRIERQVAEEEQAVPVAVKLLKDTATDEERRDLINEIKLMKRIGFHQHIVSMMGCCTTTELYLVVEFVPYGDLLNFLRKNRQTRRRSSALSWPESEYVAPSLPPTGDSYADYREPPQLQDATFHEDGTPCVVFTPHLLISFGHQITQGMEYLHSKDLVHRDLACRNVLVDDNQILKISDFGLCRAIYKDTAYVKKTKGRLPLKWMSIEAIFDREFTRQSDVWSFGVVLWEICTMGGFPYPTVPNESLLGKLRSGYRMEKPRNCSQELYDLMRECWSEDPQLRPSFQELTQIFGKMLANETHNHLLTADVNEDTDYYLSPIQFENLLGSNLNDDDDNQGKTDETIPSYLTILESRQTFRQQKQRQKEMDVVTANGGVAAENGDAKHEDVHIDNFEMNYGAGLKVHLPEETITTMV